MKDIILNLKELEFYSELRALGSMTSGQVHDACEVVEKKIEELIENHITDHITGGWIPIEELKLNSPKQMFVAIAVNVSFGSVKNYTSDPWCVWKEGDKYARWPHDEFKPTHFMYLPSVQ